MERAFADVAQLVEQSIRNRQVTGSIPVVGSRDFRRALTDECPSGLRKSHLANFFDVNESVSRMKDFAIENKFGFVNGIEKATRQLGGLFFKGE